LKKRVRPAPGIGNPEAETGQLVVCSLDTSPLMGVGNCKAVSIVLEKYIVAAEAAPHVASPFNTGNFTHRRRAQQTMAFQTSLTLPT
jgi:hypothetical protein